MNEHVNPSIFFSTNKDWVMKFTDEGIFFNRERFPDAKPDDFSEAVIQILENLYKVKFEKKDPPYDRTKDDDK